MQLGGVLLRGIPVAELVRQVLEAGPP